MGGRDAGQVRARAAAELQHARACAGRRGASPCSVAIVAWPRGSACVNGRFAYGHLVVGRRAFPNLFPRGPATCLGWPLQMPAVVDVPLNTCLADLDEALRALLKRELERHGFEGVDIAFDAPATDWSAKLTNPTVNLFLYDLRENVAEAEVDARATSASTARRSPRRRRCASRSPTRSPRGRRRCRTSTACSRRCWRSSSPTSRCPPTCSKAGSRQREPAARDRDRGRPAQGGEGRLLDLDRRPLQGVDRLRGEARGRVRPHLHARAGGAQPDGAARPQGRARRARSRSSSASAASCATRTASRWPTRGWRCPTSGASPRPTARASSSSTACGRASTR